MPVPQGLPSLSPMGEEFPLFWSLDMMRLGSSVFFCFFGRVKFGVHISARVNFEVSIKVPLAVRVNRDAPSHGILLLVSTRLRAQAAAQLRPGSLTRTKTYWLSSESTENVGYALLLRPRK